MTRTETRVRAYRNVPCVMRAGLIAAVLAASLPLYAQRPAAPFAGETGTGTGAAAMLTHLQSLYPSTHFGAVNSTPWPGVFEVVMGANLAYVDQSGRYFLFGHLFDMAFQRDLSAQRKEEVARVDFAALPLADSLKEVRGTGQRVLAIFSDPDCPYCQRLESDLRVLDNVTIHTFLMPLVSLHPGAHAKAVSVWCAKDPVAAWHAVMWRGETLTSAPCEHPVQRNVALGERLGINGTPTLIAADGRMLAGAASLEQVEAWLGKSTASAPVQARSAGAAP